MQREDLNRFLASVRKTRFIDYLDPIGETALQAFERRLRWAERSRDDAAHADEASFLLDHSDALRDTVKHEVEQEEGDDWVDAVDAGHENVRVFKPGSPMRESLDGDVPPDPTAVPAARRLTTPPGDDPTPLPGVRAFAPGKPSTGVNTSLSDAPRRPAPKAAPKVAAQAAPAEAPPAPATKRAATPRPVPRAAGNDAPAPKSPLAKAGGKAPAPPQRKPTPTLLPDEPAEGEDPWDLEQTGIMRLEDVTPTPSQARAALPKPKPQAGPAVKPPVEPPPVAKAPSAPVIKTSAKASSSLQDTGRRGTDDADMGWDESGKSARPAPLGTAPGAARRTATPTGSDGPAAKAGATPAPAAPAIMQLRSRGGSTDDSRGNDSAPARRSRAPQAIVGLLVAGASVAGLLYFLPQIQELVSASLSSAEGDIAGMEAEEGDGVAALADSDGDSDAVAEVEADSDAVVEAEDTDDGAAEVVPEPAVEVVAEVVKPPPVEVVPKVPETPEQIAARKAAEAEKKAAAEARAAEKKAAAEAKAAADKAAAEAKAAADAAPVIAIAIKGLWSGKIDGRNLFLTVTKQTGNIVEATAELQTAEGFMNLNLSGTWDEQAQVLVLTGPEDASFKAKGKEGKLVGSAVTKTGAATVSFSVAKR